MNNIDYINAYKGSDTLISDYYKVRTRTGELISLTGTISPLKIDNRQLMSPTDQQGSTPHCAAYSAATLVETIHWKKTGILKQIDSHQIYSLAKQLDGQVNMEGTYLEAAMNAVLKLARMEGRVAPQLFYNDKSDKTIALTKRLLHKYDALQVGFAIDEGWYDVTNSNYFIKRRGKSLGGHAVNLAGYSDEGVYVLNQWGTSWGAKGYAIMDWNTYLTELLYGLYLEM